MTAFCSLLHTCISWLLKLFCCRLSYPFFVGIRGCVTQFRAWGNATYFQNELKETMILTLTATRTYIDAKGDSSPARYVPQENASVTQGWSQGKFEKVSKIIRYCNPNPPPRDRTRKRDTTPSGEKTQAEVSHKYEGIWLRYVTQMSMSVLWMTEAAVYTLIAPTHLEILPVPVLGDISATDSTAQVTLHDTNEIMFCCCCYYYYYYKK